MSPEKNNPTEVKDDFEGKFLDVAEGLSDIRNLTASLSKKFESNEKVFADIYNSLAEMLKGNEMKTPLKGKPIPMKAVDDFKNTVSRVYHRFDKAEDKISSMENDMSVFQGNLMALENHRMDLTDSMIELKEHLSKQQATSEIEKLVEKIKHLEWKVEMIHAAKAPDHQLAEMLDRLIFLESRLVAVESMIKEMPKYLPLVVE